MANLSVEYRLGIPIRGLFYEVTVDRSDLFDGALRPGVVCTKDLSTQGDTKDDCVGVACKNTNWARKLVPLQSHDSVSRLSSNAAEHNLLSLETDPRPSWHGRWFVCC